ncbi:MAG: radical SAM protein [Nanoarchaeota archaeon]|nr:radical SAM protein [Nanoarchaeota archaeon]
MRRVDLMLSQQCNTNCIFCYLHGIKKSDYDFSFDKIKETLENGAAKGYKEVYISGGEPTLNNKLPEIIAYAKKLGFQDIKIMTNGLRMSYPNFLKKLIGCGLNQLAFSLHGSDAKTHDFHTNYKGSFELIEKAIDNALTYKDKLKIEVNSVITKYNIHKINYLAEFALAKGINHIHFQLIVPNSEGNKKLFPEIRDIKYYFAEVIEKYGDKCDGLTFGFVPFCYLPDYEDYIVKFDISTKFFSNCNNLFLSWKDSLLKNKKIETECQSCRYFQHCRGYWNLED